MLANKKSFFYMLQNLYSFFGMAKSKFSFCLLYNAKSLGFVRKDKKNNLILLSSRQWNLNNISLNSQFFLFIHLCLENNIIYFKLYRISMESAATARHGQLAVMGSDNLHVRCRSKNYYYYYYYSFFWSFIFYVFRSRNT
ncbi:hypothetical protein BpHYR1_016179 [Brachionus plicatilis]|uniref:Uncharacterized protein n=1 Tax=Brachionus plicatilis TaxID=10195 RepID=A0A3M7P4F3_BRAPC|nr:hypothetical protein BpHYR1_016179 [Brachionus plicatilis]